MGLPSHPHCHRFPCFPLTPNHYSQPCFNRPCFPEIMGYDPFRSPKALPALHGLGAAGRVTTRCANTSNPTSDIAALSKSHRSRHRECFISTSLHRPWFSSMFLASPPHPHSSRLFHFLLQDPDPLLEIPVDYSCFCIMQNDLTFVCVCLYFSQLKRTKQTASPFTTQQG